MKVIPMPETSAVQPELIAPAPLPESQCCYFTEVTISGLRTFAEKQTLKLTDSDGHPARWTILLGDNGVGKTTLLQCLALLQPTELKFRNASGEELIQWRPRFFRNEYWEQCAAMLRRGRETYEVGAKLAIAPGFHILRSIAVDGSVTSSGGTLSLTDQFSDFAIFGYGAIRRMGPEKLTEGPTTDAIATLFDDTIALINAEEWLLQMDYTVAKTGEQSAINRFNRVKDTLLRVLPDVTDLRIQSTGGNVPRVEVLTPYGWVFMRALSSGYRSIVAWMVELANRLFSRYSALSNPLEGPAIVLVDQVDLFLHPKLQKSFASRLTEIFPNIQFIVTAHSPLVVQGTPFANLAVIRREGDHALIDQRVHSVRGWRLDQILASDLFDKLGTRDSKTDKLLHERKQILTKSSLTSADNRRLDELNAQLGNLPLGETEEEISAIRVIREAAKRLTSSK